LRKPVDWYFGDPAQIDAIVRALGIGQKTPLGRVAITIPSGRNAL
jgi:hypothetical protein